MNTTDRAPAKGKGIPAHVRFERFHIQNPHVYDFLVDAARKLKARGHQKWSIAGLFEIARFDAALRTSGDDFKLCNDYKPLYARLIKRREPDLVDFFDFRSLRATQMPDLA